MCRAAFAVAQAATAEEAQQLMGIFEPEEVDSGSPGEEGGEAAQPAAFWAAIAALPVAYEAAMQEAEAEAEMAPPSMGAMTPAAAPMPDMARTEAAEAAEAPCAQMLILGACDEEELQAVAQAVASEEPVQVAAAAEVVVPSSAGKKRRSSTGLSDLEVFASPLVELSDDLQARRRPPPHHL